MDLSQNQPVTIADFLGQTHEYVVVRSLGDGYLADVFLMESLRDSTPVVVKVLKKRHAEADHRTASFLREADLLQQLSHLPQVVKPSVPDKGEIVLDESGRLPCTLQEYIGDPYHPVSELVETGLSEQTALTICRQFASLLHQIHSQGIIYTDLKPEHIYWDGSQIKVIDWNVVKDLSTADRDTVHEAVAKELQAFGQAMYYLLTGQSTISRVEGPSITTLLSGDFSDSHVDFANTTTDGKLSLGTRLIIERSLAESGDDAYASAEALEEALAQHLSHLSEATGEPATQTRAALSKGLAALEASDYEDATEYFTEAALSTPGLIPQSYLVVSRIRQDEGLADSIKDQVEENLTLFRVNLQKGDLDSALDALALGQATLPENREIEILHELTTQVADAVAQAEEGLAAADYEIAQQALRSATALEPSAAFLQERLQTVQAFQSRLQTGTESLEAGRFSEAAAAFETLLDHMPESASIENQWIASRLGQGQLALDRGAFAEARDAFEAILERRPDHEAAQANLTAVEERQQHMQQLEAWLIQGRTALQIGDYERALEHVNAVLELEPEHGDAGQLLADIRQAQQTERGKRVRRWLEKGHQAMANDAFAEAIECFEQAAALDPESEANVLRARAEAAQARTDQFQALLHKAHAAFRGEDYETAVRYFEEAVDLAPEALDARRGLTLARQRQAEVRAHEVQNLLAGGRAALSAGDYEDALQHFERAAKLGSDSETADYIEKAFQIRDLVRNAQAAEERGDLNEALEYYRRATEVDPLPGLQAQLTRMRAEVEAATQEQVNWLIERATAHLDSAPEQAAAWLKQACELHPDHAQATELLLTAQEEIQRRERDVRHLMARGLAALEAGDAEQADRTFTEVLELNSSHEKAKTGRVQAQQLQQCVATAQRAVNARDYKLAVSQLERALEIAPDSPTVQQQWRVAQCEVLLQRARQTAEEDAHAEALALLDEALALGSDHVTDHPLTQVIQEEAKAARQAEEESAHKAKAEQAKMLMADAESYVEAGDYRAAAQAIESALELTPDDHRLVQRRQEVMQQKGRYDRARSLMNEGKRLELSGRHDEAAEAYEIAAHLTSNASLETEARARADRARTRQRQQRLRNLVRRIAGLSFDATHTDARHG